MGSTYPHYQVPASLPSDYALLSRYAEARALRSADSTTNDYDTLAAEDDSTDEDSNSQPIRTPRSRRMSFPAALTRSSIHIMPHENFGNPGYLPTESTTLLGAHIRPTTTTTNDDDTYDLEMTDAALFGQELKTLSKFTLPVFGSHILEYSLTVSSVLTIGHLSTSALAAITLGSMTANVTGLSILQGLASALDTMLPSAWTSTQPHLVGLWSQRMGVVMMGCLIPILCIWANAEGILLGLKQDPEVARLAALYLRWLSFGLPGFAFNCVSRRYFQSQGLFTVPTRIIFIVAPINAVLNYVLVWGPEPIRLGFIGAPIASAISFNLISLMSLAYGIFFTPATAWYPIGRRSFTSLGVLVHLGLAGVAQTASEWWAWELVALAASLLGPVALAVQSILLVSASTTFQAPFAMSVATSVRIGNLLGEGKARRAKISCRVAIFLAIVISLFSSTLFMVFRNVWGKLFNDDKEVISLVAQTLPLLALFQVFDGLTAVTGGILRARGKQVTGALLNLSAYYIIGIPLGIYLAFNLKMELLGLWTGLTVSLVYCTIFGIWICLQTDWEREVRKVLERVEKERNQHEGLKRRNGYGATTAEEGGH